MPNGSGGLDCGQCEHIRIPVEGVAEGAECLFYHRTIKSPAHSVCKRWQHEGLTEGVQHYLIPLRDHFLYETTYDGLVPLEELEQPLTLIDHRQTSPIKDWRDWSRPKKPEHWKAGRSAMELARAWFVSQTPQPPSELRNLLSTSLRVRYVQFTSGQPEHVTSLPERGEGRNHDLMLTGGTEAGEDVVVCVEAKADEPFGPKIGEYWQMAKASQVPTKVPERIQSLLEIVTGTDASPVQSPWSDLRYQLLTGLAGTAIEAVKQNAPVGVFVIHEFRTQALDPALLQSNAEDYERFIEALFSVPAQMVNSGELYGPLPLKPHRYLPSGVEIFMGKAVYDWSRR